VGRSTHRVCRIGSAGDQERDVTKPEIHRAANGIYLGQTRGMGRKRAGFAAHGQPKGLFVYPLHRRAKETLSTPFPAPG
jgi:hypothetical protein